MGETTNHGGGREPKTEISPIMVIVILNWTSAFCPIHWGYSGNCCERYV